MSTQIQFLRTDQVQLRPDPNVLANGMPLLNFNEQEPGLFFKARDGSLFKVGPTAVGELAPNSGANGFAGNTVGEMWLDTSGLVPMLKVYDGVQWTPSSDPGGVSSVGLSMPTSIFDVAGSPITSAGVLSVSLQPQVRNRFLGGPLTGGADEPTFRALASEDIPGLDGSKIVAGFVDQARIPSLDATKITSGVFNSARIPGIDATKIVSGVLPYQFGGTGVGTFPQNGELLIGGLSNGWRKTTLQAGSGIGVTNGPGTIQIKVNPPGPNGGVLFNNNGVLGSDNNLTYDGIANILNLSGDLQVAGSVQLNYVGTPTELVFEGSTGASITVKSPTTVSAAYTLTLPPTVPNTAAENLMKVDSSGNATFADSVTLESASFRDWLAVQNTGGTYESKIRAAAGMTADLDFVLPASYGTGGFLKINNFGDLSVATDIVAPTVTANEILQEASSPQRVFVQAVETLNVSSDGTYTLLDIPCSGTPANVNFTVFVHDEDAAAGTGTLSQTFNAHYDGSNAVISAGSNKVDSWSATAEPTFSVDFSTPNFRIRTTTASGSNELNFMIHYTYVINVAPGP